MRSQQHHCSEGNQSINSHSHLSPSFNLHSALVALVALRTCTYICATSSEYATPLKVPGWFNSHWCRTAAQPAPSTQAGSFQARQSTGAPGSTIATLHPTSGCHASNSRRRCCPTRCCPPTSLPAKLRPYYHTNARLASQHPAPGLLICHRPPSAATPAASR